MTTTVVESGSDCCFKRHLIIGSCRQIFDMTSTDWASSLLLAAGLFVFLAWTLIRMVLNIAASSGNHSTPVDRTSEYLQIPTDLQNTKAASMLVLSDSSNLGKTENEQSDFIESLSETYLDQTGPHERNNQLFFETKDQSELCEFENNQSDFSEFLSETDLNQAGLKKRNNQPFLETSDQSELSEHESNQTNFSRFVPKSEPDQCSCETMGMLDGTLCGESDRNIIWQLANTKGKVSDVPLSRNDVTAQFLNQNGNQELELAHKLYRRRRGKKGGNLLLTEKDKTKCEHNIISPDTDDHTHSEDEDVCDHKSIVYFIVPCHDKNGQELTLKVKGDGFQLIKLQNFRNRRRSKQKGKHA